MISDLTRTLALFAQRHLIGVPDQRGPLRRALVERVRHAVYEEGMVDKRWLASVRNHQANATGKVRVSFGSVRSLMDNELTLGVRKYRIDPIVNWINEHSDRYAASVYFHPDEFKRYPADIVVIVKLFDIYTYEQVAALKSSGMRFVYDVVDNPEHFLPPRYYADSPKFMGMMDAIIASSPLHIQDLSAIPVHQELIEHPVINTRWSRPRRTSEAGPFRLIWQGYSHNIGDMGRIHPIVARLREETGRDIRIVYHANHPDRVDGFVEHRSWNLSDWDKVLSEMDVGVVIKPNTHNQLRKPSNKVLSYMSAGLPVVCRPTAADRLVLQDGVNGFIANTDEEWYAVLRKLVTDPELRETVAERALRYAREQYSIGGIAARYETLFDRVLAARAQPPVAIAAALSSPRNGKPAIAP